MSQVPQKETLLYYLPIIIALCSIAVTWGVFMTKVTDAQSQITDLKQTNATVAQQLTTIQVDVSSIKTSVDYIQKQFKP